MDACNLIQIAGLATVCALWIGWYLIVIRPENERREQEIRRLESEFWDGVMKKHFEDRDRQFPALKK